MFESSKQTIPTSLTADCKGSSCPYYSDSACEPSPKRLREVYTTDVMHSNDPEVLTHVTYGEVLVALYDASCGSDPQHTWTHYYARADRDQIASNDVFSRIRGSYVVSSITDLKRAEPLRTKIRNLLRV